MSDFYNLIIHNDPDFWDSGVGYVYFPKNRFLEYTVDEIKKEFSLLTNKTQERLLKFPTLFAVEMEKSNARVGKITKLEIHQDDLRIYFEFDRNYKPLPQGSLKELQKTLDISDREFNRTHWAIKNCDLISALIKYKAQSENEEKEPMDSKRLLNFETGKLKTRESAAIEFKESFQDNIKLYLKTIMSFANNQGGHIIFGVKDKPRELKGLDDSQLQKFKKLDEASISQITENYCSEPINISKGISEQSNKKYCYFEIKKAHKKPVICIKDWQENNDKRNNAIFNGDIYYRSSGKSEKIKYRALAKIFDEEREKERNIFIDLISRIATIGAGNISLLSTSNGELGVNGKTLTLDENLIKQLNFIKEGEFVEKKGAPAYLLKGEIDGIKSATVIKQNVDLNQSHPYEGRTDFLKEYRCKFNVEKKANYKGKEYALEYIFSKHFIEDKNIENDRELFWSNPKGNYKKYSEKLLEIFHEYLKESERRDS